MGLGVESGTVGETAGELQVPGDRFEGGALDLGGGDFDVTADAGRFDALGHTVQLDIPTTRFRGDGGLIAVDADITTDRLQVGTGRASCRLDTATDRAELDGAVHVGDVDIGADRLDAQPGAGGYGDLEVGIDFAVASAPAVRDVELDGYAVTAARDLESLHIVTDGAGDLQLSPIPAHHFDGARDDLDIDPRVGIGIAGLIDALFRPGHTGGQGNCHEHDIEFLHGFLLRVSHTRLTFCRSFLSCW